MLALWILAREALDKEFDASLWAFLEGSTQHVRDPVDIFMESLSQDVLGYDVSLAQAEELFVLQTEDG